MVILSGMSLPDRLADLLRAEAYPHRCDAIEVVETHISWVILTGEFAYKLKKPVRFSFVDFSTPERRAHFCREELRCNRQFAPSLYLDVVPVGREPDGRLQVGSAGPVAEWAVKMRQFPADAQLDRVLEHDGLDAGMLAAFGRTLAGQHERLPVHHGEAGELDERVLTPIRDNYDEVLHHDWTAPHRQVLARARAGTERQVERHRELLVRRLESGWIRECHGDLHLSNMVLLEDGVAAFDCLEFNPTLRWIDPQSDAAFLFMDCLVRERADLAYAFLDGYLDASADYDGARLLPLYASYRSMVRAKVAALRRQQAGAQEAAALERRFLQHAEWTERWLERAPGRLVLMCGLSGSGKSYLAARLAPRLPALRLRSDVARKALAGLRPLDSARADVGAGLYDADTTRAVYGWLADLTGDLLRSGEHVIVDATFLEAPRRGRFLTLAETVGAQALIVHCDAPRDVLEARIRSRGTSGGDPSDAGLAVLEQQMRSFVAPQQHTVRVDTAGPLADAALEELVQRLTA
jgi:hypothetical protein